MDRNQGVHYDNYNLHVALRKESVDRNICLRLMLWLFRQVALRKESVDRNRRRIRQRDKLQKSLSARRAWIEIGRPTTKTPDQCRSLSARRAWIEIHSAAIRLAVLSVALRKESVDRNSDALSLPLTSTASLSARRAWIEIKSSIEEVSKYVGRSPQGERG